MEARLQGDVLRPPPTELLSLLDDKNNKFLYGFLNKNRNIIIRGDI